MLPLPAYPPLPEPTLVTPASVEAELDDLVAATSRALGKGARNPLTPDETEDVRSAVESSAILVDNHLGAGSLDALAGQAGALPTTVFRALVIVASEAYRRKDAAFGVLAGGSGGEPVLTRIGADWLKPVETMLAPFQTDSLGVW